MGSTEEENFAYAVQLVTSTSLTMVLRNTIQLKALEVIAEAGPDAHLSAHEIVSRLSITNTDAPDKLDRMLRLLASHSIVTCTQGDYKSRKVRVYGLAPVAKYLIPNEDGASLGVWMELMTDKVFVDSIEHVGGDMFQEVPQADAILMKWVLHDWSDEHCTKLLKNCYKALPQNGKVIVIDEVLPFVPDTSTPVKARTQVDTLLMTHNPGGKERTEDQWLALAKSAGFKVLKLGPRAKIL
ncbi:caffeic acid 3-O-methyltransferase [Artemisia annua]|uniref:Caffeic acid 3-O-methyltransferase n=1 Tax=Artemisia annua TaxID=35608 RepID=A0A2U1KGC5_ARTAN|nr:caffeic acid 3-O-methyltransferase [Artemisia annua]